MTQWSVNMQPGKARLLTGIACVGTLVTLSSTALYADAAQSFFPASPSTNANEFGSFFLFFVAIAGLLITFDLVGGIVIPAACESRPPNSSAWLRSWSRSVAFQTLLYSVSFFFYLQIGREFGMPWLIAAFATLQVILLAGQELIWRLTSSNRSGKEIGMGAFVQHVDQRFVGGVAGLPGFERILIPAGWKGNLRDSDIELLVTRRRAAVTTGLRLRGVICAMVWNVSTFAAAIIACGGGVQSVADLISAFLWFMVFSFAGLLVLPMFNRRGVFALDHQLATSHNRCKLQQAIFDLDGITEQDPNRSATAESIFQPIPCPERRSQALSSGDAPTAGPWNVARTALFLSWAFGGPLARAVHCNVGRPELWAMLPTD